MTALTGTGGLVRLILRRDRFVLPAWIVVLTLIPINFVKATESLYPTAADRLQYAHTSGTNPTFLALYGPLYSPDLGGIIAQRCGFIPVIIGLISALTVVRHTRAEEEAGRRELLGATVTGRGAGLAAALLVTMAANLVLAALLTAGMAAQGLPLAGSLAFGLQLAAAGCVFAAVAGVTAQLSEGAGAARGTAVAALGAAFTVRMAADVGGAGNGLSWLGWLSPLGWGTRVRAYGGERWWTLALVAALVAVLVAAARRAVGPAGRGRGRAAAEARPRRRAPPAVGAVRPRVAVAEPPPVRVARGVRRARRRVRRGGGRRRGHDEGQPGPGEDLHSHRWRWRDHRRLLRLGHEHARPDRRRLRGLGHAAAARGGGRAARRAAARHPGGTAAVGVEPPGVRPARAGRGARRRRAWPRGWRTAWTPATPAARCRASSAPRSRSCPPSGWSGRSGSRCSASRPGSPAGPGPRSRCSRSSPSSAPG
ncbi:hypothetical protein [Actinomadura madurae]|uniref:hypothetical protein n=1 Tax=Actinomadura madurae TaxID=1993 RepID=UPI0020D2028C|nr:hypothetical protein [Actinomadura madurae]MCQ0019382.1 hypothetical protein [Actinomadura madurae]